MRYDLTDLFLETVSLMQKKYDVNILDYCSEEFIYDALMDSEEPEAIVDETALDYGLKRKDISQNSEKEKQEQDISLKLSDFRNFEAGKN